MSLTNMILSPYMPKPIGSLLIKHVWIPLTVKVMVKGVAKMSEPELGDFLKSYKDSEPWLKDIINKLVFGEIKMRNLSRRAV